MATLGEHFRIEAVEYLDQLDAQLRAPAPPSPAELHRCARLLRGTAQMARADDVFRAARALEAGARALMDRVIPFDDGVRAGTRDSVGAIRQLLAAQADTATARADEVVARWRDLGVAVPEPRPAAVTAPESQAPGVFRNYAAGEVRAILAAFETGVAALGHNPMDREALKSMLRSQRALLGASRLDQIGVLAETLRAVEDVAAVIAKMNVPVKDEWLDVFRSAREVLRAASERLEEDLDPLPTNPLSRLRTLHEELIDRYGSAEAVSSAAPASDGLMQAVKPGDIAPQPAAAPSRPAMASASARAGEPPLDILDLCYDGRTALERALLLRPRIEAAFGTDTDAREALDEVFDLIRLALE